MKRFTGFILVALVMLLAVPAFGSWIAEADYFDHKLELRPDADLDLECKAFGWYYAGYDSDGFWELGISYYEWTDEIEVSPSFSHQLDLYPTVFYIHYKFRNSTSPDWVPFAGLGYGSANVVWRNIDKTGSGLWNYMESKRYDVFSWTVGVRYYFDGHWGLTFRYIRHEIDVSDGLIVGGGYNFGAIYRF